MSHAKQDSVESVLRVIQAAGGDRPPLRRKDTANRLIPNTIKCIEHYNGLCQPYITNKRIKVS